MKPVKIEKIIEALRQIPEAEFTCENIYDFLTKNPVAVGSIKRYYQWKDDFYTRNLIYKDERFEIMALCWEPGQQSPVHNHNDQKCWMMIAEGTLYGKNFRVLEQDEEKNFCELEETDNFELSEGIVSSVDLDAPIHQILNLPEFGKRAVSLHIYSKPYDKCLKYDLKENSFSEVRLHYYSIDGKPCEEQKS